MLKLIIAAVIGFAGLLIYTAVQAARVEITDNRFGDHNTGIEKP